MAETSIPDLTARPATTGGNVRAIIFLLFTMVWTTGWGVWCMIGGIFNAQKMCKIGLSAWSRGLMVCSGVRVAVIRKTELDPNRQYVFLSNHQSAMDIPILMQACFPAFNPRFMAKESLFKIPFMGWAMSRTGFIPIRRESPRHSAEMFQEITNAKTPNPYPYSYIIFPEGTRSDDGRLQSFKKGSLGLALRLGLPVVPVTLIDACRANPKGKYCIRAGTVHVAFHTPIEIAATGESNREDRDALLEKVYSAVLSALPADQRPADGA